MACLESAIFSIDLDDDHNDDIIYQEGGSGSKGIYRFINGVESHINKQLQNAKQGLKENKLNLEIARQETLDPIVLSNQHSDATNIYKNGAAAEEN